MVPFFVTIPHSGEKIPDEVTWLRDLDEVTLMFDVDRFVDRLYEPSLRSLQIPYIKTEWHRYVVDLNRLPTDIDCASVEGNPNPKGSFSRGFHWSITTLGHPLMKQPISNSLHEKLVKKCFEPFHQQIKAQVAGFRHQGYSQVYHLDAHSMPSVGTSEHRDPGQNRASFVISDQDGKSCSSDFKEIVKLAYEQAGFDIQLNWPYKGGRITEMYGQPSQGHHTIQVEMNRALYMDETTKQFVPQKAQGVLAALPDVMRRIQRGVEELSK